MDFPQRKIDLEENLPSWLRGDRHSPPPYAPFELVHPMDDAQIGQTVQSAAVPTSDVQNSIIFDLSNRYAYFTLQPYHMMISNNCGYFPRVCSKIRLQTAFGALWPFRDEIIFPTIFYVYVENHL